MPVPTQRGSTGTAVFTAATVVTPTTLTPVLPAHFAGDLLLVYTACRSATPTVATPSGWTQLVNVTGTNGRMALFGKIAASSSETNPGVVWSSLTTGASGTPAGAQASVWTGLLDTTTGLVDATGTVQNDAAATTTAAGGVAVTTLINNSLVIAMSTRLDDAGTWTAPTSHTMIGSAGTTSGLDFALAWAGLVVASPGSSGNATFGLSGASSFASSGVRVALETGSTTITAPAQALSAQGDAAGYGIIVGEFPTVTTVLDSFNRANESPISGSGKWTNQAFPLDNTLDVDTNQLARTLVGNSAPYGSAYRNDQTYGPDIELQVAVPITPINAIEFVFRLVTPGTSGVDGYLLDISSAGAWGFYSIVNNVQNQIGSNATQVVAAGGKVGLRVVGNVLEGYYKAPTANVWNRVLSRTDGGNLNPGAGNVGLVIQGSVVRLDDFIGGTYSTVSYVNAAAAALSGSGDTSGAGTLLEKGAGALSGDGALTGAGGIVWNAPAQALSAQGDAAGAGTVRLAGQGALSGDGSATGAGTLLLAGQGVLSGESEVTTAPEIVGVFPTTDVLDNFNRANESPVSDSGGWIGVVNTTDEELQVTSNQLAKKATGILWGSSYRSGTYGPNTEVFATVATWAANSIELYARLQTPGTLGVDGYMLDISGSDSWSIYKILNGDQSIIGSAVSHDTLVAGDQIAFELIGTTLKGYHKPVAGVWTEVISRTDSDYTAAGNIGVGINNNSNRVDNFGGGTIEAGVVNAAAADLSGESSLSGAGTLVQAGAGALSGDGAVTATPIVLLAGQAVLSGQGDAAGAGTLLLRGQGALDGTGNLTTVVISVLLAGQGALAGTGDVTGAGRVLLAGHGSLAGQGDVSGAGGTVWNAPAAALAGRGDVTATPVVTYSVSATLTGTSDLTAAPVLLLFGSAALTGESDVVAFPEVVSPGVVNAAHAALSGESDATGAGTLVLRGYGDLAGTSSLVGAGTALLTPAPIELSGDSTAYGAGDTVVYVPSVPVVLITAGPNVIKISHTSGQMTCRITWHADVDIQAYEVEAVDNSDDLHGSGIVIPTTNGSINTTGDEVGANTNVITTIDGRDLELASAGDGMKLVKVFAQSGAGDWSEA